MNSIGVKKGAIIRDLAPPMWIAIGVAWELYRSECEDFVITSGNDGKHMDGSLHYENRAVDIRTRNLTPYYKDRIFEYLKKRLGRIGFDVVLENGDKPHIHIEWDPKAEDLPLMKEVP